MVRPGSVDAAAHGNYKRTQRAEDNGTDSDRIEAHNFSAATEKRSTIPMCVFVIEGLAAGSLLHLTRLACIGNAPVSFCKSSAHLASGQSEPHDSGVELTVPKAEGDSKPEEAEREPPATLSSNLSVKGCNQVVRVSGLCIVFCNCASF